MINIDENNLFGIIWDVYNQPKSQFLYGTVIFSVGENMEIMPKYIETNTTLQVVFGGLKASLIDPYYTSGSDGSELGEMIVDHSKLVNGEVPNLLVVDSTEISTQRGDYKGGVLFYLGYSGKMERLFYSSDNGLSFSEIRLPRNTVESVIMSLPSYEELEFIKNNDENSYGTTIVKV